MGQGEEARRYPDEVGGVGQRPAADRCREQADGREQHQPLVCLNVAARAKGRAGEHGKDDEIGQCHGEPTARLHERHGRAVQRRPGPDPDQQRDPDAGEETELAMQVTPTGTHERDLDDEQDYPAQEDTGVHVDAQRERRERERGRSDEAAQQVAAPEPHEHARRHKRSGATVKESLRAGDGPRRRSGGGRRQRRDGHHEPSWYDRRGFGLE